MSHSIRSKYPFITGTLQCIGIVGYFYYFHWLSIELNEYFESPYWGYVISFALLIAFGIAFFLAGKYVINIRLGKRNSIHARFYKLNPDHDPYGVTKPIIEYKRKLDRILESITESNFDIDDNLLVSLYTHGLQNVKERFWTTTYLTSGFWTHGRRDVKKANELMLSRLNNNGDVKRIFLLRNSINEEIKSIATKVTALKSKGEIGEIAIHQIFIDLQSLKDTCSSFIGKDCKIKFIYDELDHSSIGILKNKTEIAIYDDFRIDYFDGGEDAQIKGIKVYTENHDSFDEKRSELTKYFSSIWSDAKNIDELFQELERAYHYYYQKIDYTFPRLIKFDADLYPPDQALKEDELNIVLQHLKDYNGLKGIKDYLDIGTCTGRYPFSLNSLLSNSATLGIDVDEECIEYCNIQREKRIKENPTHHQRTLFKKMNFLYEKIDSRKFGLITCMLGTISHFGWNKTDIDFNDDLQKAIEKMKSLLSTQGLLIISNWTEIGLDSQILSIYNNSDQQKLRKFTDSTETLIERLSKHFSNIIIETTNDAKIDVIFCKNE
jgi:SAM-dependent methyltransferase